MVKRFEIYLLAIGQNSSGVAKQTRPCVIISPDEMNRNIASVIVAPVDSAKNIYPTRPAIDFLNKKRSIVLDQIRTVDKSQLAKKVGELDVEERATVLSILQEMFAA